MQCSPGVLEMLPRDHTPHGYGPKASIRCQWHQIKDSFITAIAAEPLETRIYADQGFVMETESSNPMTISYEV